MWEKEIWIAKRYKVETNDFGVDIEYFEKPIKYRFNYQPVSGNTDIMEYGEKITNVYRTFVNKNEYLGKIRVGDRVYLEDGEILESELENIAENDNVHCEKANYIVKVVLPQNFKTRIDFIKK